MNPYWQKLYLVFPALWIFLGNANRGDACQSSLFKLTLHSPEKSQNLVIEVPREDHLKSLRKARILSAESNEYSWDVFRITVDSTKKKIVKFEFLGHSFITAEERIFIRLTEENRKMALDQNFLTWEKNGNITILAFMEKGSQGFTQSDFEEYLIKFNGLSENKRSESARKVAKEFRFFGKSIATGIVDL